MDHGLTTWWEDQTATNLLALTIPFRKCLRRYQWSGQSLSAVCCSCIYVRKFMDFFLLPWHDSLAKSIKNPKCLSFILTTLFQLLISKSPELSKLSKNQNLFNLQYILWILINFIKKVISDPDCLCLMKNSDLHPDNTRQLKPEQFLDQISSNHLEPSMIFHINDTYRYAERSLSKMCIKW